MNFKGLFIAVRFKCLSLIINDNLTLECCLASFQGHGYKLIETVVELSFSSNRFTRNHLTSSTILKVLALII